MSKPELPVVLLGGTLCDARLWQRVVPQLSGVHVIVPDGFGAHSADEMAALLLNELPERFLLCGFSLGAIVALHMMAQAPLRLAGLALISVNPLADAPENASVRRSALAKARRFGLDGVIEDLWPRYVDQDRLNDFALKQLVVDMAVACGPTVFAQQIDIAIQRRDVRESLRTLAVPLTLIGGQSDPICTPEHHALLAQASEQASWHSLPGCGHFVPLEAPEQTASILADWIRTSSGV